MFILYANKTQLTVRKREQLTSGSVNIYRVRFEFSDDWKGMAKTAVFKAGNKAVSVLLPESGEVIIPWETLVSQDRELFTGVYGTKDGDVVLPTIWTSLGTILEGVTPGSEAQEPTPGVYEQILDELANKADGLEYDGLNLSLKAGDKTLSEVTIVGGEGSSGVIPDIQATVTTLPAGAEATVERTGTVVKPVFNFGVPRGNTGAQGERGEQGEPGEPGADGFSPEITVKENTPDSYILTVTTSEGAFDTPNLKGAQGEPGQDGAPGMDGAPGVDGKDGKDGENGTPGKDATINGENVLEIVAGQNVNITQEGGTLTISAFGGGLGGVPSGCILIWSGAADNIPDGWALCDGEEGRPDLRDKFVLGAGEKHAVGETGGSEEVTLTVEQMPAHSHNVGAPSNTYNGTSGTNFAGWMQQGYANYTTRTSDQIGNSKPHPNMPPYYTLCYIIKL